MEEPIINNVREALQDWVRDNLSEELHDGELQFDSFVISPADLAELVIRRTRSKMDIQQRDAAAAAELKREAMKEYNVQKAGESANNPSVTEEKAEDITRSDNGKPTPLTELKGVGESKAEKLANEGIKFVHQLAECSVEDLTAISGIGESSASSLIEKARAQVDYEDESYEEEASAYSDSEEVQDETEEPEPEITADEIIDDSEDSEDLSEEEQEERIDELQQKSNLSEEEARQMANFA